MIELLVFDVDGCLSDGKLFYSNNGDECKSFDTRDGFGIVCWHALGKKSAIITGKTSQIVDRRAKDLGIKYVFQGVKDKLAVLKELLKELGLELENVAAIGDDMNDYRQLKHVGWSFAPADALPFIHLHVKTVLKSDGGKGAVREMIEVVVDHENLREEFIKPWL
ncbi:MAG: HAD hydrolase family protein [Campylobacteraceae bacterium]|jgi:3-deoxy-D-manno-octulosonate 8-phosphate phosphatase (KDO 8-P phosphatase)|nr:HAD hydrolase family protein [Campylobacteraceae bacterium]